MQAEPRIQSPVAVTYLIDNSVIGELHMITQKQLKKSLHYNPETGIFTWLLSPSSKVYIGDKAGSLTSKGYLRIGVNKERHMAHRLAWLYMTGHWPKHQIDHDNRIKTDNSWGNINEATNQQNHMNSPKQKNNTSGFNGVRWHKAAGKWAARIYVDGKDRHLGVFDSIDDAIAARERENIKHGFHPNHGKDLPS